LQQCWITLASSTGFDGMMSQTGQDAAKAIVDVGAKKLRYTNRRGVGLAATAAGVDSIGTT
jgi:hypothetical protein